MLFQSAQDQADMASAVAIMVVILVQGVIVDALFGQANKAIRRRWGLT
ncbi:MAG: hypothetical protein ACRDL8_19285 [Solirubrobacteraceae bacterium]